MKNNETGEFELVLGNRQLLSGFFVVVILFAVFFVMGYIVGRNTAAPQVKVAASDQQAPADNRPDPASAATPPAQNPPANTDAAGGQGAGNPATPSTTTPPANQPANQPAAQPPNQAPSQAETKSEAPPAQSPAAAPGANTTASAPAPGETYLQVVSVAQHEAEIVARSLKEKGFPSSLSPGPNGRTRVLVGPFTEVGALGKAKSDLENLGFHPIVKR